MANVTGPGGSPASMVPSMSKLTRTRAAGMSPARSAGPRLPVVMIAWSQPGDGDLSGVLHGEPVADGSGPPGVEHQVPGELAQVGLARRVRAGLAEPHLDLPVLRQR